MKSKTCTLHAISLCLLPLLTAGCLSDNLLSDHPGTSTKPMEIRMKSYIAGSTSAATRADGGKGMINGGTAFDVKFARVDENAADTDYPTTYDNAAIPGSVNTSKVLSFAPPAYYQTDKTKGTKLIGWHPAGATYVSSGGTVVAAIDGETDIMVTPLKVGSQNSPFSDVTFSHLLMQICVKVYTTDEKNKDYWGGIKSITIAGKKQTCTVTLPATSASAGATATAVFSGSEALPLIKKDPSNNTVINQSGSAYGDSNPLELGVGTDKTSAVLAGYAMFEPAGSNSISLTVVTEKGGTQAVTVRKPNDTDFVAGGSYIIPLCFGVSTISPTGTSITDWSTSTELPEITV
jgi:hypothetical protein